MNIALKKGGLLFKRPGAKMKKKSRNKEKGENVP